MHMCLSHTYNSSQWVIPRIATFRNHSEQMYAMAPSHDSNERLRLHLVMHLLDLNVCFERASGVRFNSAPSPPSRAVCCVTLSSAPSYMRTNTTFCSSIIFDHVFAIGERAWKGSQPTHMQCMQD